MEDKNKKDENENIDFTDGISFKEARFAFGLIASGITLIMALVLYVLEGDITRHFLELALGFAGLLICEKALRK